MKRFVMLIFFVFTCAAMEDYSRLECLPMPIKLIIIKDIIHNAGNQKNAFRDVYNFIIGDRVFLNFLEDKTYKFIKDHLRWHWNDERNITLALRSAKLKVFQKLKAHGNSDISDPELLQYHANFLTFYSLLKTKSKISSELLESFDLYHHYRFDLRVSGKPPASFLYPLAGQWTPAYAAVLFNRPDVLKPLLELGCDTQKLADTDMNPLHLACKKGDKDLVALFIKHKVPLNAQTRVELKTAAHLAAENGKMEIMHMLVRAGADRTIKDRLGYTPNERIKNRIAIG